MFSRLSIIATIVSVCLAAATNPTTTVVANPQPTPMPASQCNSGNLQCCNSVQSSDTPAVATLLDSLGIVVQGVSVPIGLTCSPISLIAIGSGSCTSQPVCCSNNDFDGVVAIGCTVVNISL